jgi:hypothetical protein
MRLSHIKEAYLGQTVWTGKPSHLNPPHLSVTYPTHFAKSLDRTNFVQDILSRTTLEQYLLLVRREWIQSSALWSYHRELWAENGDALSRIYAGTGALNTSFTRSGKRTFAGQFPFSKKYILFNSPV